MIPFNIQTDEIPAWIQAVCAVISAIITGLGTYYIVKSFNEQKKINNHQKEINKQQLELNRLAMEEERRKIRPYFKAEILQSWDETLNCRLYLENAIALKTNLKYAEGGQYEILSSKFRYKSEWPLDYSTIIQFTIVEEEKRLKDDLSIVTITFSDEIDRAYEQHIAFVKNELMVTVPKLIDTSLIPPPRLRVPYEPNLEE